MRRIHVHDFKFEYYKIENTENEKDFYCSLNVYFNFSKNSTADSDDLEYFNISVVTPFGLAKYLRNCIQQRLYERIFFFPHILIVENNDEDLIMDHIRTELESIHGKTENEIILKAMSKFSWEGENVPEVYNGLFK